MILEHELIVDNYAGGGGASTGLELGLNRSVDIAINHDPLAIDMHKVNHPHTKHFCESVWDVDPVKACAGRPVGLGWFSPDCRHFSVAKGAAPVDRKIRGLAWVVVRWAALVPMRMFMLENVPEFLTWGPTVETDKGEHRPCKKRAGETFAAFVKCLTTGLEKSHPAWAEIKETLGDDFPFYKLEKGLGYNVEHNVLTACEYGVPTSRKRLFMVGRNDGAPIVWPEKTHGPNLKPFEAASSIIDWSIPTKSIFDRKKPLAEKTLERIAHGLEKFVINCDEPFIAPDHAADSLTCAYIAKHYTGVTGSSAHEPLHTVTAVDHNALVTAHLVKFRGQNYGQAATDPLQTISANGNHFGVVTAFLIKYFGTSTAQSLNDPIGTLTAKERYALVVIKGDLYQIADIGMRMLEPHELYAAMGFPAGYQISHNSQGKRNAKKNQVARCGNAVCPRLAKLLAEANTKQPQKIAA